MTSRVGRKRRDEMKDIREEDLRARIRNSGHLTEVNKNIDKMQQLASKMRGGEKGNLGDTIAKINALQMVNNQRWKALDKVLPTPREVFNSTNDVESHEQWLDRIAGNPSEQAEPEVRH